MQVNPFLYNIHMVCPVMTRKHVRGRTELPGLSVGNRVMSNTVWSVQPPMGLPCVPWMWVPPAPEKAVREPEGLCSCRDRFCVHLLVVLPWGGTGNSWVMWDAQGTGMGSAALFWLCPQPFANLVKKPSK